MEKKDVIGYIVHTPCNSNPAVVGSLLDELIESNQKPMELDRATMRGANGEKIEGTFYSYFAEDGSYVEYTAVNDSIVDIYFPKGQIFYLTYSDSKGGGKSVTISGFCEEASLITIGGTSTSIIPIEDGNQVTFTYDEGK